MKKLLLCIIGKNMEDCKRFMDQYDLASFEVRCATYEYHVMGLNPDFVARTEDAHLNPKYRRIKDMALMSMFVRSRVFFSIKATLEPFRVTDSQS